MPGRGTNHNERLHRELNRVVSSSRYGVELAYALITCVFYNHNENMRAKKDGVISKPISAYSSTCMNDIDSCETFGLATPRANDIPMDAIQCNPESQPRVPLKELDYSTINKQMMLVLHDKERISPKMHVGSIISKEDALLILQKSITHYYITQHLSKLSKSVSLEQRNILFLSILAMIQHSCENHHTESTNLESVLSSWNFRKVDVPGDGNCLFTSVALSILERIQNHDQVIIDIMTKLGLSVSDLDIQSLSTFLRELVVREWLGDNADYIRVL